MRGDRKEEIILTTLALAAEKGLSGVSMGMIADRVGMKKPSLYNYFSSREEIVEAMYGFLREKAKAGTHAALVDYAALFAGRTALEVLRLTVGSYLRLCLEPDMRTFYRVIYSERSIQPAAAAILAEETERMLLATKQLFYAMQAHRLLCFRDADMSAASFALTIHGLMDYGMDRRLSDAVLPASMDAYLRWFCEENAWKEETES